jgi:phage terminase large subunit-like protein
MRTMVGRRTPRLATPARRKLGRRTSYGYAVVDFARDVLREPLDPWEAWLVVHLGELLADGRPRFRQVLVLVARQNGKTHLLKVLALFWLFVETWPLVVGMSTNLDYAREAWLGAVAMAEDTPDLAAQLPRGGVRLANGQEQMETSARCRYRIAASNRRGGRSLSIDRLILDELREHADWSAWAASVNAMQARPQAQVVAISNQGDESAVVLDSLRSAALDHLDHGEGDDRLGLFEWSAEDGCDIEDPRAWAAANPNMGRRIDVEVIASAARRAARAGGEEEAQFRTEVLCQRVRKLDPAIDSGAWRRCSDPTDDMTPLRGRVAFGVDLAPDGRHATLVGAAVLDDQRVRVAVVKAWEGPRCADELERELPGITARLRPRAVGWLPNGPAAALAAGLAERKGRVPWPPPGVTVEAIRGDAPAACMGLRAAVEAGQIAHSDDPLLTAHVTGAERQRQGDRWVFRRAEGHVDAAYATAAAVHLARTLPAPVGKPRLVIAGQA